MRSERGHFLSLDDHRTLGVGSMSGNHTDGAPATALTYERAIMALARQVHPRNWEVKRLREELLKLIGDYDRMLAAYQELLDARLGNGRDG